MGGFSGIKFKTNTAVRFRKYSGEIARSHSEAMEIILDFFQENKISPFESPGPAMNTLEYVLKKRINSVIAIIRNIEKTQTKPSHAMLQLLFQESPAKKGLLVEKKVQPVIKEKQAFDHVEYQNRVNQLKGELSRKNKEIISLLEKVVVARNNFGKTFLRLNISKEEFEKIKTEFENSI